MERKRILDFFLNTSIKDIALKILDNQRINKKEIIRLYQSNNLFHLGLLANFINNKKNKNKVYFRNNLNINHTNICQLRCPICAFSRDEKDEDAYCMTFEQIQEIIIKGVEKGICEVHIVGGITDKYDISFFEKLFQWIKKSFPFLHIQALTAVEYDYLSKKYNISLEKLFNMLKQSGLDGIPGGGAEIFDFSIRKKITPFKISGKRWLEIIEIAHSCGIKSNATMLYGHIETFENRIDHLLLLRNLQDKTSGFMAFVPLAFHKENTEFENLDINQSAFDDLLTIVMARIILDNFDHIKILPNYFEKRFMSIMLNFGVSDIGATSLNEKIVKSANGKNWQMTKEDFVSLIKDSGKIPIEINSSYIL
ncbi:MAG: CofH family radical SAM protein [bacterium]